MAPLHLILSLSGWSEEAVITGPVNKDQEKRSLNVIYLPRASHTSSQATEGLESVEIREF